MACVVVVPVVVSMLVVVVRVILRVRVDWLESELLTLRFLLSLYSCRCLLSLSRNACGKSESFFPYQNDG